ncbi:MAG: BON domain-containing protein [Bacteroidetes bacterium]|nr:BON domain-containing protein [Bacteroidota bacterium]
MKKTLDYDHRINANEIDIKVVNGTIWLQGTVNAFWKKDIIEKHALRIPGVEDVIDNLTVKLSRGYSDDDIKDEIINAFKRNAVISEDQINVIVDKGKVTLSGTVTDYVIKSTAKDLAIYTPGITKVIDNIIVRHT